MNKLEVIFVDTNSISLDALLASSFLSDSDIASLARFKVEEVKKEKACSLIFKNRFVGDYHINEFGKPISDNCFFNISHSNGAVIFAKDEVPVGVDIERLRPVEDNLVDYISSKEEKEYIQNETRFFEIWTSKESLTKAIGTGIKDKIKEIPGLPINDKKKYKDKMFYSRTVIYKEFVITVTREKEEPFEIEIKEIKLWASIIHYLIANKDYIFLV